MFVALSFAVAIAFLVLTVLLPFRFAGKVVKHLARLQEIVLTRVNHAIFASDGGKNRRLLLEARILGGLSAFLFLVLVLRDRVILQNTAEAFGSVVSLAFLGLFVGGILLLAGTALVLGVPRSLGYAMLNRFGFRSIWIANLKQATPQARECFASRLRSTRHMGIIDLTGFELLGKGPGPGGGIIYDILDSLPKIPVEILLLKPDSRTLDPDELMATVFQSTLAEMAVSSGAYSKRIQATLNAVDALNENRADDAIIEVRFYSEKPMARTILLEESVLVSPWDPREKSEAPPMIEIAKDAEGPTLYEAFRRNFSRLWGAAASKEAAAQRKAAGSQILKIRQVVAAEEHAAQNR